MPDDPSPPSDAAVPAWHEAPERPDWGVAVRLACVATAWIAASRLCATQAAALLPRELARALTLESYLAIVQVVTTLFGLGLAAAFVPNWRRALGLVLPSGRAVGRVALASPIALVAASYLGVLIALPTLRAELLAGGARAVKENAGALGRALQEPPLAVTLLWSVVLAPAAEELMFRGALWSALASLTRPTRRAAPRSLPRELFAESIVVRAGRASFIWLRQGGFATLGAAALFAGMHALDAEGGTGIVRVVSALVLGVACGIARHASGSVVAAVALHTVFNLLGVLQYRGDVVSTTFPKHYGVATLVSLLAGVCALALVSWLAAAHVRARRRARGVAPPSDAP